MKLNQPTQKELIVISKKSITDIKKGMGKYSHNSKFIPSTRKAGGYSQYY